MENLPSPSVQDAPIIPGLPQSEQVAAEAGLAVEQAWEENAALSRNASPEELERDAGWREHGRNQLFKQNFEIISIVALWGGAMAIAAVGLIWIWHLVMPTNLRWLTCDEIDRLQSVLTAGLLVSVIGNHFKKRLS